ncbi:MAG: alpha-L-arabinofuranosidase C-terminal domain-containing protein [bacterium]|nr:alpha-L-arabinofuranosidase C-terminal domain-containing protein [bacterium]
MNHLTIHAEHRLNLIEPEIYGHFSEHLGRCIYEGIYVGEESEIPNENGMRTDVVTALREIQIPVLRWPGGCFADEYHWKDGIGPKNQRKKMINTHWGGIVEDNRFGTHEYFELCRQLGCKTYISGNMGSGTVREMSEWIEYMTFDGMSPMTELRAQNGHKEPWKVDYFGIGNENWGCGGNMRPEYYIDEYRRYQTYVRNYHSENKIQKVCCGPNDDDFHWTRKALETAYSGMPKDNHGTMDGFSLHYYVVPEGWSGPKGSATEFNEDDWYKTLNKALKMETLIIEHGKIMEEFDPEHIIGMVVDEWGCWYDVEPGTNPGFLYQQNTMRDAVVAAVTLNLFNSHSNLVKMANLAQAVNVLQAVLLTEGSRMVKTPTWYVFHMFRHHQGARLLRSEFIDLEETGSEEWKVPGLSASASIGNDGLMTVTICNLSVHETQELTIDVLQDKPCVQIAEAYILTGEMNHYNTFDHPWKVQEEKFQKYEVIDHQIRLSIPGGSIVMLRCNE